MAFADFFRTVKNKASQVYSNFFYDGRDVPDVPRKGRAFADQEPTPPSPNTATWLCCSFSMASSPSSIRARRVRSSITVTSQEKNGPTIAGFFRA